MMTKEDMEAMEARLHKTLRGVTVPAPKVTAGWIKFVSIGIVIVGTLATLLTFGFIPRIEAQQDHEDIVEKVTKHSDESAHKVAQEQIKVLQKAKETTELEMKHLSNNIILIGERLRVRGLKGNGNE